VASVFEPPFELAGRMATVRHGPARLLVVIGRHEVVTWNPADGAVVAVPWAWALAGEDLADPRLTAVAAGDGDPATIVLAAAGRSGGREVGVAFALDLDGRVRLSPLRTAYATNKPIRGLGFAEDVDGHALAVVAERGRTTVWRLDEPGRTASDGRIGRRLHAVPSDPAWPVSHVTSGGSVVAIADHGALQVLDLRTGEARSIPEDVDALASVGTGDAALIVGGSSDGTVRVWGVDGAARFDIPVAPTTLNDLVATEDGFVAVSSTLGLLGLRVAQAGVA
jgi:hypothetical protein